jgi:hypothetical protein
LGTLRSVEAGGLVFMRFSSADDRITPQEGLAMKVRLWLASLFTLGILASFVFTIGMVFAYEAGLIGAVVMVGVTVLINLLMWLLAGNTRAAGLRGKATRLPSNGDWCRRPAPPAPNGEQKRVDVGYRLFGSPGADRS